MDAPTLIASLVLAAGAFGLVLYPLWQQSQTEIEPQPGPSGQTLEEYQARYQAALAAIKDLVFDYEMGKVSAEDYERLLAKSKLEAAEIRHQLDRLSHTTAATIAAALDVEIERQVAQLRQSQLADEWLLGEVDAEINRLKTRGLPPAEMEEAACPHCGQSFLPGDAFCAGCGQPLPDLSAPEVIGCPACGYAYQPGDAFCARCGLALIEASPGQPVKETVNK